MTPFKALYGRDPPPLVSYVTGSTATSELDLQLSEWDALLAELKDNLLKVQQTMQVQAHKKSRDVSFEVGDLVFLKLQPYRHRSLARVVNEKLSRYYGPFPVIACIRPVAYKLQFPAHAKLHPVFHVSRLKKAIGPAIQAQSLPPILAEDLTLQVEPEQLVDTRYSPTTGNLEVLIKWQLADPQSLLYACKSSITE